MKRRFLVVTLLAALLLAACGSDADDGAAPTADTEADDGGFPVDIEHRFGTTTIEARPERVVSVGFNEQDALLALGVKPVAVREWFGEQPSATWPWAHDLLDGAEPEVLPSGDLNFEAIAALEPDLIIGLYAGLTQEQYDTLSAIAPTLAQTDEFVDYGMPWQDMTLVIGEAVGQADRAQELVDDVEAAFTAVREAHPEFAGATGLVGTNWDADLYAYSDQDGRGRLLDALGFDLPPDIAELAGTDFTATISEENLALFDTDVLVWITEAHDRATLEQQAVFPTLDVGKQGRIVWVENADPLGGALSFNTVLSLPYLLDELVPQLAAALDGDPATTS